MVKTYKVNLIIIFVTIAMASCGGGGSSGNNNTVTPPSNSATVSISSSPSKVFLGNSTVVSWNSTNASSCEASGSWSGDKSTSGSETFAMTNLGDQVFTIRCGGASSNVTIIVSSEDFEGSCMNPHKANIPQSYLGEYKVPMAQNSFGDDHLKAVGFKDYGVEWIYQNYKNRGADWIADCTENEYIKLMYRTTLNRLKENGVTTAWIYNFGYWQDKDAELWQVDHDTKHLDDWVIEYVVEEAQKLGMNTVYAWQFLALDAQNKMLFPFKGQAYVDMALLKKIMDAHEEHILWEANRLQELGVTSMSADWQAMWLCFCGLDNEADKDTRIELKNYYMKRMGSIVTEIKIRFDGEVYVGEGVLWNDKRVFDQVDGVIVGLPPVLREDEVVTATVDLVEKRVEEHVHQLFDTWACNTVQPCWEHTTYEQPKVIWNLFAQSHAAFLNNGWVEDGFCTQGTYEDVHHDECLQYHVPTDFSAQAIFIEGMLRAIDKQSWFETKGTTASTGYWLSDSLIPDTKQYPGQQMLEGFPNISQSIRGKPAEKIIKYWYSREYEAYAPIFTD